MRRVPVLWLCGPSGVGKSTVGYELFEQLGRDATAVAFVDLDQLRLRSPASEADPMNHRLRALTLGGVWSGLRAAGARCVVLSGLVDDADDLRRHAARMPGADLTVCRLRVGDDELRQRFERRGAYLDLTEEAVRNAADLDRTDFADLVVDTSGLPAAEVVARVRAAGWPGPRPSGASPPDGALPSEAAPPPADAEPQPPWEPVLPLRATEDATTSVLLICGPPAVGKSAVGFEVYRRAARRDVPAAYVDLAQIGFCRPAPADDPDHHRLKAHNLHRMWTELRADGVRFLVVTGNVTGPADVARYRAAVPSSAFSVCRLRARPETLTERILLRGRGGGPGGLMGDDLRGRPEADLLRRAGEASRVAVALDRSRIGDSVVDTDGRHLADLAVHVSCHVSGRAVRDDLHPDTDDPAVQGRWTWDHPDGPRWLLVGDVGVGSVYEHERPLALCGDIDGLFVDLPPRPRERFTLIGCTPAGPLADVLARQASGSGPARLGGLYLWGPPSTPDGCPLWWGESLGDVTVLGHRPSATVPGTVDIDIDGFVHVDDRTNEIVRPNGVTELTLQGPDDVAYGTCRDVTGLFRDDAEPPVPLVRLLGCRPEPALRSVLDGDGPRPVRFRATVYSLDPDGTARPVHDSLLFGTVAAVERSASGLLDVTIHSGPREPLPTAYLRMIERWRAGPPTTTNEWAGYDRETRHYWSLVAPVTPFDVPDRPAGAAYHLDGRFVTDIEGFYCALGEAINGPGGYFGLNLDGLHDCLDRGFGARTPFTLVWHHSAVARAHLVEGYDPRRLGPAVTLDDLLALLTEDGVTVDLR